MDRYDDVNEILTRAFPLGARLIRLEGGGRLMHLAAHDLIANARLAVEVLGPRGAATLARAMITLGQRHIAVAERIQELVQEAAPAQPGAAPAASAVPSEAGDPPEDNRRHAPPRRVLLR